MFSKDHDDLNDNADNKIDGMSDSQKVGKRWLEKVGRGLDYDVQLVLKRIILVLSETLLWNKATFIAPCLFIISGPNLHAQYAATFSLSLIQIYGSVMLLFLMIYEVPVIPNFHF